jgi:hypothetical protein
LSGDTDTSGGFGWAQVKANLNIIGAKTVVIPSQPAGMALADKLFGRMGWRDLLPQRENSLLKASSSIGPRC